MFNELSVYKNRLNNYESYVLSKGKFIKNKAVPIIVLQVKNTRR